MAVTTTNHISYGSRIGNSLKGIVTGFVMLVVGIGLLWWNEGRAVRRYQDLKTGRKACVETPYDTLDKTLEGKLVHVMGSVATDDVLVDPQFKISRNGFALLRKAEMYQWQEKSETTQEENVGGSVDETTTYTYEKSWSVTLTSSDKFVEAGHDNPKVMRYRSNEIYATNVKFGAHTLTESQISQVGSKEQIDLAQDELVKAEVETAKKLTEAVPAVADAAPAVAEAVPAVADAAPALPSMFGIANCVLHEGYLYIGASAEKLVNPLDPEIGDIRISFAYVSTPKDISIVGQQTGDKFTAWQSKNGTVFLMTNGLAGIDQMFTDAEHSNALMTWVLRIFGFALIFAGFKNIFGILPTLAAVLPFLGKVMGVGVSFFSFILATVLSLLVIALSWLWYRPVLGVALLVIIGAVIWYARKKAANAPAPQQPAA
jgi:hypothetical protein